MACEHLLGPNYYRVVPNIPMEKYVSTLLHFRDLKDAAEAVNYDAAAEWIDSKFV